MKNLVGLSLILMTLVCSLGAKTSTRIEKIYDQVEDDYQNCQYQDGLKKLNKIDEKELGGVSSLTLYYDKAFGYFHIGKYKKAQAALQLYRTVLNDMNVRERKGYRYVLDELLLEYYNSEKMGNNKDSDSLYNIIRRYTPQNADSSRQFCRTPYTFFPLIKLFCQRNDFMAAEAYAIKAKNDTLVMNKEEVYYDTMRDIALGYIYYKCGRDSAMIYLDRASHNALRSVTIDNRYIQTTCSLLKILIAYNAGDIDRCGYEMSNIERMQGKKLKNLPFDIYFSPLTDEEWNTLLQIEKMPRIMAQLSHNKTHSEIESGETSSALPDTLGLNYEELADWWYNQGYDAYLIGDYKEGINGFKKAIELHEQIGDALDYKQYYSYYYSAMGYYMVGQYDQALEMIKLSVKSRSSISKNLSLRISSLQCLINAASNSSEADDTLFTILEKYAQTQTSKERFTDSKVSENSIAFSKDEADVIVVKALCCRSKYKLVIEYLQSSHTGPYGIESAIAYAYYRCGQSDSALVHIEKARQEVSLNKSGSAARVNYNSYMMIKLLLDEKRDMQSAKEDIKELYRYNTCNRLEDIKINMYYSPIFPEDWKELLRIEKELKE